MDMEIKLLQKTLEAAVVRSAALEKENQELRCEVARLKAHVSSLKAHDNERKSILWKKLQNSMDSTEVDVSQLKPPIAKAPDDGIHEENLRPRTDNLLELRSRKDAQARVPIPSLKPPSLKEVNGRKMPSVPAPPPPPPSSNFLVGYKAIRRVPEVIYLYRLVTRKDTKMDSKSTVTGAAAVSFTKNMIGEIEHRSTYLSAIKSDVEKQGEFINFLIKAVQSAAFREISEVETFVKWLDEELSSLVDERAVLKHFPQWPERKADTLREASCTYRELTNLESEVVSFADNPPKETLKQALRRMQALQDRLERAVNSVESKRESSSKKYRDFQIPWQWMQNTGLIGQMKLSSMRLARECMSRITRQLRCCESSEEEEILLQGVRFAYKVHQFAGGFDMETIHAFEEFKKLSTCVFPK